MLGMDIMHFSWIINLMPKRPAKTSKRINKKRKMGFSWRRLVKSNKAKKTLKNYATYTAIIIFSVFFLGGISIYRSITKSFANAESFSSYDMQNKEIVTLVVVSVEDVKQNPLKTKSIHYLIFDKNKQKVLTYEIDTSVKTDVVGKFGQEPYSNVLSIGMMNDDLVASGANLLINTIKRDFAFNVDKYLIVNEEISKPIINTFVYGEGSDLLNFSLLQEMFSSNTNLMFSEFYHLFTFSRSLRTDRFVTNSNFDITHNKETVDEVLRDITFDSKISKEKTSVGILNGTNIPGIASFASRVISNSGGYVISAENAFKEHNTSMLVVSSRDFSVISEIQNFFGIDKVVLVDDAGINEAITDRVDVTLVLGFDISDRL